MTAPSNAIVVRRRPETPRYEPFTQAAPLEQVRPRIAGLDGIRAVAILLVLVHNAGSVVGASVGPALKLWAVVSNAGWIGVQLFFGLSGFLITRILLEAKGGDRWMPRFYVRRALRIMPLYFALLAIVFLAAPHVGALHGISGGGSRSSFWYWTYLSNWIAPFGGMAAALPHVWSLAVEEQFYVVWPLAAAVAGETALAWICGGLVAAALAGRLVLHALWSSDIANSAAYTWTLTRWDAIALGALVAIAFRHTKPAAWLRKRAALGLSLSVAALAVLTVFDRGLASHGLLSELVVQPMAAVMAALLVAVCVASSEGGKRGGRHAALVRLLSFRPLEIVGKYSYAIYVFHLPLHLVLRRFAFDRLGSGDGLERFAAHVVYTLIVFAVSFALAWISWRVLEHPFLSLKRFFPMPASRRS